MHQLRKSREPLKRARVVFRPVLNEIEVERDLPKSDIAQPAREFAGVFLAIAVDHDVPVSVDSLLVERLDPVHVASPRDRKASRRRDVPAACLTAEPPAVEGRDRAGVYDDSRRFTEKGREGAGVEAIDGRHLVGIGWGMRRDQEEAPIVSRRPSTSVGETPRHSAIRSRMRARTRSRSSGGSALVRPAVGTGGRTFRWIWSARPKRQSCLRRAFIVPSMATGRMGTCSLMARRNAPSLKASMRPSRERVPSGKNITEHRSRRYFRAVDNTTAPLRRSPRLTGISPAIFIIHPTSGTENNSAFATHFISQGRRLITGMSANDW